MLESGPGGRGIFSSNLVWQTHGADAALVSGAWLEVGLFSWGHHRSMEVLLVIFPDSVRTSGRCCCEGLMWKWRKVGSLALPFQ